jgi:hypothetical protein
MGEMLKVDDEPFDCVIATSATRDHGFVVIPSSGVVHGLHDDPVRRVAKV